MVNNPVCNVKTASIQSDVLTLDSDI